jgi:hypothetical protein
MSNGNGNKTIKNILKLARQIKKTGRLEDADINEAEKMFNKMAPGEKKARFGEGEKKMTKDRISKDLKRFVKKKKNKKTASLNVNRRGDNLLRRAELISDDVDIEVKPLNKGAQSVPGGLSKKDIKPVTMNMGGQVDGVEDLTTEMDITE